MLDEFKRLTIHQYEAALRTLDLCVEACPNERWNDRVASYKYCQVVFHTLFFTDLYLGRDAGSFREQPFHRQHSDVFRDYEELEDRPPVLVYDKAWIKQYVEHCRSKLATVVGAETIDSLLAPCGFPRKPFSRAELHVYNMRHIQHHAAQLSLRLRLDGAGGVPWVRSGWEDVRA